jgi:hypothetical protein
MFPRIRHQPTTHGIDYLNLHREGRQELVPVLSGCQLGFLLSSNIQMQVGFDRIPGRD